MKAADTLQDVIASFALLRVESAAVASLELQRKIILFI
jgi:hypothetical protein